MNRKYIMTSPAVLMKARNLKPKKQLGQNFLSDPNMAEAIAQSAGVGADDIVLEIGAGLGALTRPLARRARKVIAVEKDRRLISLLKTELAVEDIDNVSLLEKDILKLDLMAIAGDQHADLTVMGNVPYNISSQILVQIIKARSHIKKAVLMFQKELAQRITSEPGSKSYGRLSVMIHYCASVRTLTEVKARLFYPKPNIDSLVLDISFNRAIKTKAKSEAFLFDTIKAAFSKRRKTLKNSLAGNVLGIDTKTSGQALVDAGIDPVRRAETLSVEEFVRLSDTLYDCKKGR